MKIFSAIALILILGVLSPAIATCGQGCDGQINILNVVQIDAHHIAVNLQLNVNANLNLVGSLGVDVNAVVRVNNQLVFVGVALASFQGNAGETVTVHIAVSADISFVNADITISLGNLHLDLDANLNILLGPNFVCRLVNGVLQVVNSVLGLLTQPNCIVSVVNVQVLAGNKLQVSLQLQSAVIGGLSLDLNVNVLGNLGIVARVCSQTVSFSGIRGQVVVCILDVSGAVNLLVDSELALQLAVSNVHVNLNLNAIVDVALPGLDNCFDAVLQVCGLPHIYISTGALDISAVVFNSDNTLSVTVSLNAAVAIGSVVNVDLDVVVYSSSGILLQITLPCHFLGLSGETVVVNVDLHALNLSAGVFVYLELANLDVALNLNLDLCSGELFSLLNGLLSPCLSVGSCH